MKKFITLLTGVFLLLNIVCAQYFQGSFSKDPSDTVNLKIAFKMKPTVNITTGISYIEAAFRYPTATTQSFTITNITSNTTAFPGLAVQRFTPDYVAGGYTYVKFVFNTATIPSAQYISGTEYQLFTITTSLPSNANPPFSMASNLALGQYQFGVVDGAGNFIDPGTAPQLYGPGFTIVGNDHILPISFTALPVKMTGFNLVKNDRDVVLTWTAENQDAGTIYFEIERSLNGIDFRKIGTVGINLANGANSTYAFKDANTALGKSVSMIYYRIKQVNVNGKFVYTEIRNVNIDNKRVTTRLYPNPASQNTIISFELKSTRKVNIRIVDVSGSLVQDYELLGAAGLNYKPLNISRIPVGVYSILIKTDEKEETLKLVKVQL